MSAVRILMVDDHSDVRAVLEALLSGMEGHVVVGEAADGSEATAAAEREQPDVVLLDLAMPGLHGLRAPPQIRRVARVPE